MNSPISSELVRRAQARQLCPDAVATLAVLGEAVDAGVIELGELLDLVRSCSTADELGDALAMLAASAQLQPAGGCAMKHALTFGAMLGGAAFLFTLAAFPSLLVGLVFGVLAGVPAALLVLVTTRRPQPAANDTDALGEGFSPCTPARYEPLTAAPAAVEDDDIDELDDLDDWGEEPVPVVVDRTAARFASLEVRR